MIRDLGFWDMPILPPRFRAAILIIEGNTHFGCPAFVVADAESFLCGFSRAALPIEAGPPQAHLGGFAMSRGFRRAAVLAIALAAGPWCSARAQWGYYPRGYAGYGWGGWGGGAQTPQGSIATGLGAYAAGAGYYNQQTAVARSINTDTAMRFNEYMYESEQEATRQHHARLAGARADNTKAIQQIQDRLRNHPDAHDIRTGDALNAAVAEIEDPRAYTRILKKAQVKIGGELIRDIPFRYAPGAITVSIHRLTREPPPPALLTADFDEDRAAFKVFGTEIRKNLAEGEKPDAETVKKALAVIDAAEAKADRILPRNTKDRTDVDKYLKALHGLLGMLQTPAIDILLAGVEKHPDATLGELLGFMSAFNLRFGEAKTPRQQQVYDSLYPKLVDLRDEVAPALAAATARKPTGSEVGDFFSAMDYADLRKKAPAPPPAGAQSK
jgi:hypothetical protein